MFGNSKEYQDIQKLYLEKVSKPEQLDEGLKDFIDKGGVAGAINRSMKKNEPIKKLRKAVSNIEVGSSTDSKKIKPFKSLAPKKPIGSNKDTSSEIESSESEFKANEGGKFNQAMKNKMSSSSGSTRPTAQDLAKKRIGSGTARNPDTTIAQANQRNRDAMRDRARERNTAFQKRREEFRQNRKAGISNSRPQPKVVSPMDTRNDSFIPDGETIEERLGGRGVSKKAAAGSIYPGNKGDGQTEDQDRGAGNKAKKRAGETVEKKSPTFIAYIKNKKEDKKEDKKDDNKMEAYDVVLEYLLSTQQAATIEEANYIMTEMNAKTIQDIVSQQLNEQN